MHRQPHTGTAPGRLGPSDVDDPDDPLDAADADDPDDPHTEAAHIEAPAGEPHR